MSDFLCSITVVFVICAAFLIVEHGRSYPKKIASKLRDVAEDKRYNKAIRIVRLIFGVYAACLFVVVFAVNAGSWLFDDFRRYTQELIWLDLLIFAAFLICCAFLKLVPGTNGMKSSFAELPKWVVSIVTAFFIYFFVLYTVDLVRSDGGYSIREEAGNHFIKSWNKPEREMSPEEYSLEEREELRESSAFLMPFSFLPAVYLLRAKDKPPREKEA